MYRAIMDGERAMDFLRRIAFTRLGGSPEEKRAADIISEELFGLGIKPVIEEFEMWTYANAQARVQVLEPYQAEYGASAVGLSGVTPDGGLEAPLKYVETGQPEFLHDIQGTILLAMGSGGAKGYERAKKKGVVGRLIIGGAGRELINIATNSFQFERFGKLPTAYVRYEDALEMLKQGASRVRMFVSQDEFLANSRNVVADIPGTHDPEEIILVGAHFDSVIENQGAHDNGAGSATIMEMARYFSQNPAKRTLRFVWFGSEEFGLKGAWHYIERHKDELDKHVFMVNVDVAGGIVGQNSASVMGSDKLQNYLDIMGKEFGIGLTPRQSIYSGDCIPLGYKGVPSVTFARGGGGSTYIHSPGDTLEHIDGAHLAMLGDFVLGFTDRIANAGQFPFGKEIPESIKKATRDYIENSGREIEEKAKA